MLTRHCRLDDVNKHCLQEFRKHWECLDDNNQQLWQCRRFERPLNKCVFESLVRMNEGCLAGVGVRVGCGLANNQTEAGEEDTRCSGERGPSARAQATDLRAFDDDPIDAGTRCIKPRGVCKVSKAASERRVFRSILFGARRVCLSPQTADPASICSPNLARSDMWTVPCLARLNFLHHMMRHMRR